MNFFRWWKRTGFPLSPLKWFWLYVFCASTVFLIIFYPPLPTHPTTLANSTNSPFPRTQPFAPAVQPLPPVTHAFSVGHTCLSSEFRSLRLWKPSLLQFVLHQIACVMSQLSLGPVFCIRLMLVYATVFWFQICTHCLQYQDSDLNTVCGN